MKTNAMDVSEVKSVLVALVRDLVWCIPVGMLLLAVYGAHAMIVFAVLGGTIRAWTSTAFTGGK